MGTRKRRGKSVPSRGKSRSVLDRAIPEGDEKVSAPAPAAAIAGFPPALTDPQPRDAGPLESPLAAAPPVEVALEHIDAPNAVHSAVTDLAREHGPNNPEFWRAIETDKRIPRVTRTALRTSVDVLDASGGDAGVLRSLTALDGDPSAGLTPERLVALEAKDWRRIAGLPARRGPLPDAPEDAATIAAAEHYARTLSEAIERRYPTERFVHELARDERGTNPLVAARDDIATFVANNPDFHLVDTPITGMISGDDKAKRRRLKGLDDPDRTIKLIASYQRLNRLLPEPVDVATTMPQAGDLGPVSRYRVVTRLLADGFTSAITISALPFNDFRERYADTLRTPALMHYIYHRAQMATNASLNVAIQIKNWVEPNVPQALPRALPSAVSWSDTFGALDACECGHCLSIHSPGAYLFDCLRFLEGAGGTTQAKSALGVLKGRRGDLLEIVLTCDNTNTRIPYIDVVNELLEKIVVPGWFTPFVLPANTAQDLAGRNVSAAIRDAFAGSPNAITLSLEAEIFPLGKNTAGVFTSWHLLDQGVLYSIRKTANLNVESAAFQTSGSEEELRATPQHTIPAAYRKLEFKVFPWSAPFSLAWSEIQEYLDRIDMRPGEIIDAFAPPTTQTASRMWPYEAQDAVGGAYLGLSPVEFQIIAGQKTAGDGPIVIGGPTDFPQDFWGYGRAPAFQLQDWNGTSALVGWLTAVWRVPQFLERSGLSYTEMLELLGCHFVNPPNAANVGGRTLYVASRDPNDPATCQLAKLEIRGIPANGGAALATNIHRLVRLKRRIGWAMNDLDRVLVALGVATMDRDTLVAMSIVERLRRRTGLELPELAGWFGDIDHSTYFDFSDDDQPRLRSFYEEAFRIPDSVEPGSPFAEDPATIDETITQYQVRLAARLGVTEPELDRLRSDERVLAVADRNKLTLPTLSSLTRYASLARVTGMRIDDLLAAADTFGFAPFPSDPNATMIDRTITPLRFLEALDMLSDAGVSPATGSYLLTDAGQLESPPALGEMEIVAAVNAIVDAVRPVLKQLEYPADAAGETVARELSLCGWPEGAAAQAASFFAGRQLYTTQLLKIDAPLEELQAQTRLVFDESTQTLSVQGSLSLIELDDLLQIAGTSANFKGAVGDLYDQPRSFADARLQHVLAPEYSIPLARVPANLRLPEPLTVALKFNADRRALVFRGNLELLSLVEYPSASLNQEWTAFKAAVNALTTSPFPAGVTLDPPAAENQFFSSVAERDSLLDGTMSAEERCEFALERISKVRWRLESEKAVVSALSAAISVDESVLKASRAIWAPLVVDAATGSPTALMRTQTSFSSSPASPVAAVIRRLHKLGLLFKSLALPANANLWLLRNSPMIGGPDLLTLPAKQNDPATPWDAFAPLLEFARAFKGFLTPRGTLLDLMDVVSDPTATHSDWWTLAAGMKGWEGEQVKDLTGSPAFPAVFDRPQLYLRLLGKMKLAERCGVSAGTMMDWKTRMMMSPGGSWTGTQLDTVAGEVKAGVRAKVGRERWLQIATEVNDPLRERRRDALVTYVLSRPNPWDGQMLRDADQLFAYLLIDTQMASCMLTSRIVQASGSVQSFMQRALMGLEPGLAITGEQAREWNSWRKQYRVWEANRKVFLYPENWIEPELRDDKSALFREVEGELLQSALSAEPASKALVRYVDGLVALSDLEVIGSYRQNEWLDGEAVNALHVVARSNSLPRQYFYRCASDASDMDKASWTPWSKVDVDVDGDYVLPFATRTDVYLFWMLVGTAPPKRNEAADALKRWEIKVAWSRLKGGVWTPKKMSREVLYFADDQGFEARDAFMFSVQGMLDCVAISCSGIRTITSRPPSTAQPNSATKGPPLSNFAKVSTQFSIVPKVVDGQGKPIADVDVTIWEISKWAAVYYASGIVSTGTAGPSYKSYSARTNGDGVTSGLPSLLLEWSEQWGVYAKLPSWLVSEFESPASVQILVDTPEPRQDGKSQSITVTFTFHRRPALTTTKQLSAFGLFQIDWSDKVYAGSWPWGAYQLKAPTSNITWSDNAYVEESGSDDRLYLPENPSYAIVPHTPGLYRLRALSQAKLSLDPFYFFESSGKRYHISYRKGPGGGAPILRTASHPFALSYARLAASGEDYLLLRDQQERSDNGLAFPQTFSWGTPITLAAGSIPIEEVSFKPANFFGSYNWELFFHLPFAIATQLMRNQRFADAQRWLHFVYDPTSSEANVFSPAYCWKFRPFFEAMPQTLADLFADPATLEAQLKVLRKDPFNPYAIARLRIIGFMKNVVMKYLDNLIAWGDQLFARDSMESINEATQLYLLAYQILGPRPQRVPRRAKPTPQSYRSLSELAAAQSPALSEIGAIAVEVSSFMPLQGPVSQPSAGGSLGMMMYFCLSSNDKLTDYWKRVEDRLYKLRHCLDIKGRFRVPALFEPPIDPALLVRARAAGVDISDVLADNSAPLPSYRFSVLSQKATELCTELKSLGALLLSALEKRDGEELGQLRQRQEISLLPMVEEVRKQQIEEADAQLEGLRRSQETVMERQRYYLRLLGKDSAATTGAPGKLDYLPSAVSIGGGGDGTGDLALSQHEIRQLSSLEEANGWMIAAGVANAIGGVLHAIPDSAMPVKFGGSHLGNAINSIGTVFNLLSGNASYQANRTSIVGSHTRRQDDWILQHNLAVSELRQMERQIIAAEIRKSIAVQELENQRKQAENTKEVESYLKTKFTNQQLYEWFLGQLSSLYFESYRLTHTVAKRAERTFRQELGREDSDFIRFSYWDDLKKGLLSGERLAQDLKRMEVAYLDENAREYEVTKHVSLASLSPTALIELRRTGVCEFTVPEWAFDLDYAGHYMRRIKSVGVTVPCVVGPYSGVNCTLTLQSSSVRVSAAGAAPYGRKQQQGIPQDDARFVDRFSAAQSIVTSTAQADTGLFETNYRDDRYLPFEGHGVISRWRVELPAASNSIDPNTISDVILHVRFTAREGGASLGQAARTALAATLKPAAGAVLYRLISVRQEFPDLWHRFLTGADGTLGALDVGRRRFPLLFSSKKLLIQSARDYYAVYKGGNIAPLSIAPTGGIEIALSTPPAADLISVAAPKQNIALTIDRTEPDVVPTDLLVVLRYKAEDPPA